MKWECLAIILQTPLKEEWVSILRLLFEFPLMSLIRCNAHFSLGSQCKHFFFSSFVQSLFYRKLPGYGPHELWNGPPGRQHGPHGRDGQDGHGQDGPRV